MAPDPQVKLLWVREFRNIVYRAYVMAADSVTVDDSTLLLEPAEAPGGRRRVELPASSGESRGDLEAGPGMLILRDQVLRAECLPSFACFHAFSLITAVGIDPAPPAYRQASGSSKEG